MEMCLFRLLMDDRPFWWVQETSVYKKGFKPILRQTPLTCETGPGSPSGHVQGLSAVFYVLLKHLINTCVTSNKKLSECTKLTLKCVIWSLYVGLVVLVGISRLYTATHFPHQTLLGLFAGNLWKILFKCLIYIIYPSIHYSLNVPQVFAKK